MAGLNAQLPPFMLTPGTVPARWGDVWGRTDLGD